MQQPEGFEERDKDNLVCRLRKFLYGLKQASRCWYKQFDSIMMSLGFSRCEADHCAYFQRYDDGSFIIFLLYVNDKLVASPNMYKVTHLKAQLARELEMKDLSSEN